VKEWFREQEAYTAEAKRTKCVNQTNNVVVARLILKKTLCSGPILPSSGQDVGKKKRNACNSEQNSCNERWFNKISV